MTAQTWRGRLAVVGVGLEGLESASPRGRRLLEGATLIVGTRRHLRLARGTCAQHVPWDGRPDSLAELLAGRDVTGTVLLASGDPNLFGIGSALRCRFGPGAVDVEPAVSSVTLALARANVPVAGTALLSAHGRSVAAAAGQAASARTAAILTDRTHGPADVAQALHAAGVEGSARLVVAERLGGADERVTEGTVLTPPPGPFDPLTVVVLDRRAGTGPHLGAPESDYDHEDGMITKAEVRAIVLAAMDLAAEDVAWDLGAGSGSVAVEAGRLASRGLVYAVERLPERARQVRENASRHGSWNVHVIEGDALDAMSELPDPDAVFLGGGGRQVATLTTASLNRLRAADSAVPGRLVACLATLESVLEVCAALRWAGVDWRLSQIQVSRGRQLGGRLAWEAANPVQIVSARVPRS